MMREQQFFQSFSAGGVYGSVTEKCAGKENSVEKLQGGGLGGNHPHTPRFLVLK